jgi:hypothetical protein
MEIEQFSTACVPTVEVCPALVSFARAEIPEMRKETFYGGDV